MFYTPNSSQITIQTPQTYSFQTLTLAGRISCLVPQQLFLFDFTQFLSKLSYKHNK